MMHLVTTPSVDFSIGSYSISKQQKPFVIAEAGGNHNGLLSQAIRLIEVAAESGADAVKFALSRADTQYAPNSISQDFNNDGYELTAYELIKKREVPFSWIPVLSKCASEQGIQFMASSFDYETTDILGQCDVSAYKIASYECTHIPLIRHIASKNKPVILSVGLASYAEIDDAVQTLLSYGNRKIVLLHCIASYPAPIPNTNLYIMNELSRRFNCLTGISDHSTDPHIIPIASTVLGAAVIEKHFTLSKRLPGADHPFALEPNELKEMVDSIDSAHICLGTTDKRISPPEECTLALARRTIFSTEHIFPGDAFTEQNTRILRRGGHPMGLLPKHYDKLLTLTSPCEIDAYQIIPEDVINHG